MTNNFLKYLLSNDAEKCVSKTGIRIRKALFPVLRLFVPLSIPSKLKVIKRVEAPKKPCLFVSTHHFKEDIECAFLLGNKPAYILVGSLSPLFHTFQGIAAWLSGLILVDRLDKRSRRASKEKMVRALKLGTNVIIFPEGTWNKSPNLLMNGLFPGVYDVALETGAQLVPIATLREGKTVYGSMEKAFDITQYERAEGIQILRDKLATMVWDLMEAQGVVSRDTFPHGEAADQYWKEYIDGLMAEVPYYEYEEEKYTKYIDKSVTEPKEVFAFMERMEPRRENAFLWRK